MRPKLVEYPPSMSDEAAFSPESGDAPEVEIDASPQIDLDPKTVSALRSRGGNLYIWADQAGMLCARATPPYEAIRFDTFFRHDCSIHIDQGIYPALRWRIRWKRLPWPHFTAIYNADTSSGILDAILDSAGPAAP